MTGIRRLARRRDEGGAAAVEFALVLVPLLFIVFAAIQYGVLFWAMQSGTNATNQAARQLAVGNCQTSGTLSTYVNNLIGSAKTSNATVTTTWINPDGSTPADPKPANVQVGGNVSVTVTFQAQDFHFPFVPYPHGGNVTKTVQARVEDTTDQGCGS